MKRLLKNAIEYAQSLGAQYADARWTCLKSESISVKNSSVQGVDSHLDWGIGVRVLHSGSWGFAANPDVESEERMRTAVERAVNLAKASARAGDTPLNLAQKPVVEDKWASPFEEDPFEVPLEEKLDLLISCTEIMDGVEGVALTTGSLDFHKEQRIFMDSEGSCVEQEVLHSGGGISAMCLLGGEVQVRSYPSNFRGNHRMAGYEFIREMDLKREAPRLGSEVVQLHTAMSCPEERMDLILGKSQLVLQVHESCGHAVELDRVLGYEANFAGTSFLTLDKRNAFQYGSKKVNLFQDGTSPQFIGSSKYDDEGVPCSRTDIVKDGVFVGYLKSRDSAEFENGVSNGAARAQGWNHIPIVRMTNVHLAPGEESLEELISSTRRGMYLTDNSSWSIDDKRWNFQFGTEIGWLIENGKITKMVKHPTYTGITPEFWGGCEGIASEKEWEVWGTPHCGKGQPMQVARVGHGVSYAKFSNVRVGVSR
jgi:TldD protein